MNRRLLSLIALAALFTGCHSNEKAELQTEVDSLRQVVAANQKMSETLQQVGTLLDSIDSNRHLLRVNMMDAPMPYTDFVARMDDLNSYVKETEAKISQMEKEAGASKSLAASYSRIIKKMKEDLQAQTEQIASLQEQVDKYRNENQNLIELASLQEAALNDKQAQIEAKQQELADLETKIQNLMIQSKVTEADGYYARAQALEEAANRTKLAPKKKKETLGEALDLYKKAYSLGKKEARDRITSLEAELK